MSKIGTTIFGELIVTAEWELILKHEVLGCNWEAHHDSQHLKKKKDMGRTKNIYVTVYIYIFFVYDGIISLLCPIVYVYKPAIIGCLPGQLEFPRTDCGCMMNSAPLSSKIIKEKRYSNITPIILVCV